MYGPGRPFMAAKHSAVSSMITGPPIYQRAPTEVISCQLGVRNWRRETDNFRCTSTFFDGYLLCRSLDFRYCVPSPVSGSCNGGVE